MKKAVRSIVRKELRKDAEVKYVTNTANEFPVTVLGAANVLAVSQIGEGTSPYQRIGKEVNMIGCHIKGVVTNNGTVTNFVRFALVQSKDDNPVTAASLIFSTGGVATTGTVATDQSGGYTTGAILSGLDTIYYKLSDAKLNVLKQWTIRLGKVSATDGTDSVLFSHFVKRKQKLLYRGTGDGTCSRPIYLIVWAAEGPDDSTAGNLVELNAVINTYFTDM